MTLSRPPDLHPWCRYEDIKRYPVYVMMDDHKCLILLSKEWIYTSLFLGKR